VPARGRAASGVPRPPDLASRLAWRGLTATERNGRMADTETAVPASLTRRLIAEAFGTYLLVFGVIGAALFFATPDNGGALSVALAVGLAVLTGASAVGSISGGHSTPAVTVGAAAAGRSRWADLLPYWIAQIVGGVLATLTFGLVGVMSGKDLDFAAVSNGFGEHSPLGFGMGSVIVAEIVATMLFVLII